jgi:hypothetical protein
MRPALLLRSAIVIKPATQKSRTPSGRSRTLDPKVALTNYSLQESVAAYVGLLEAEGIRLGFPYSSGLLYDEHLDE